MVNHGKPVKIQLLTQSDNAQNTGIAINLLWDWFVDKYTLSAPTTAINSAINSVWVSGSPLHIGILFRIYFGTVVIAAASNLSSVGFPACGDVRVPRAARADRLLEIGAIVLEHIGSSWHTEFLSYLSL